MTRGVYLAQVLWPMPSRTVEARQRLRVTRRSPIRTSNDVDGGSIGPLATIHDYRTMRTKQLDGATTTGSMRTDDYPSIGEGRRVARTASPAKTPDRSVGRPPLSGSGGRTTDCPADQKRYKHAPSASLPALR